MSIIKVTLSKIRLQNISSAPAYIPSENEVVINRTDNNIYYGKSGVKTVIGQDTINAHIANLVNPHNVTLEQARSENDQLSGSIDVNANELLNVSAIKFDINNVPAITPEGTLWWNTTEKTLNVSTGTGATLQIGQETQIWVYNNTIDKIDNGTAVFPNGEYNGVPTIGLARTDTHETVSQDYGLTTVDIEPGEYGQVVYFGKARGLDTSMFDVLDTVWISPITPGG